MCIGSDECVDACGSGHRHAGTCGCFCLSVDVRTWVSACEPVHVRACKCHCWRPWVDCGCVRVGEPAYVRARVRQ